MTHELKAWPEFYDAILKGDKRFELRKDDRMPPFKVGDTLRLREWTWATGDFTGRELSMNVTYLLRGRPWLAPGYVAMSVTPANAKIEARRE